MPEFVVYIPFDADPTRFQWPFIGGFYLTQNRTSPLSERHVFWSTRGPQAMELPTDVVGTSHTAEGCLPQTQGSGAFTGLQHEAQGPLFLALRYLYSISPRQHTLPILEILSKSSESVGCTVLRDPLLHQLRKTSEFRSGSGLTWAGLKTLRRNVCVITDNKYPAGI